MEPAHKKPCRSTSPVNSTSFPKSKIKVLLLENLHEAGVALLKKEGFSVECLAGSLAGPELIEKMESAHLVGVRSKTKLTAEVLQASKRLKAIGCFCIGTDQTDLKVAEGKAIPVFNSPFSNSRSVAELVISHLISLSRRLPDHIREMHSGQWQKTAVGCNEVRGKTLGIVGYGHIGTQLGVLAESMGIRVLFTDILPKLALGNAQGVNSLQELLPQVDFLTMHVPDTPTTRGMIGDKEIAVMRKGAYLLNLSRGSVVDLPALKSAIDSNHLGGCAVDVYPKEPAKNGQLPDDVPMVLAGCRNTILTPHIGGSTEEAQAAIGIEVAGKMISYLNTGCTSGAANFPNIAPSPLVAGWHRILHAHHNVPGVLKSVNEMLGDFNIRYQQLVTTDAVGYLVIDVAAEFGEDLKQRLQALETTIVVRILY